MTLLIDLAIRSSVMLAVGLLLSACLSKRSAALRHRVLAAALLAAAVVMPVSLALPDWNVTLPARVIDASTTLTSAVPVEAPNSAPVAPQPHAPRSTLQHPVAPRTVSPSSSPGWPACWLLPAR